MRNTLTITQHHYEQLRGLLLHEDQCERVAYLLCGRARIATDPWDLAPEERFLCREVIEVSREELIESTASRVTWSTATFLHALQRAEAKGLSVALVHNHPAGMLDFSEVDNANEPALFNLAFNRNGEQIPHLSIILSQTGELVGRVWRKHIAPQPFDTIRVLGDEFRLYYSGRGNGVAPVVFNRQQLAFGPAFVQDLQHLRVGVVGTGATGSATVQLLLRLGVGYIALFDRDKVDYTNLNRLHGAHYADAVAERDKVAVLKREIDAAGLETKVAAIPDWASAAECRDALKACDIVFGCTDDNAGRQYLNRLAYFYLIPVLDMGLQMQVREVAGQQRVSVTGRVSVAFPRNPCLMCWGVINVQKAYAESLRRTDLEEYERRKAEAYVVGEGNPSPAVVTFTTEVASMAVNEMIHRFQGFRLTGAKNHRMRLFNQDTDLFPASPDLAENGCRVCGKSGYWGRGDMNPFMDMTT